MKLIASEQLFATETLMSVCVCVLGQGLGVFFGFVYSVPGTCSSKVWLVKQRINLTARHLNKEIIRLGND